MTERKPLVLINGQVAELPAGDNPAGADPSGAVATHNADAEAHGQTSVGRAVLTATDQAAARSAIGVDIPSVIDGGDFTSGGGQFSGTFDGGSF